MFHVAEFVWFVLFPPWAYIDLPGVNDDKFGGHFWSFDSCIMLTVKKFIKLTEQCEPLVSDAFWYVLCTSSRSIKFSVDVTSLLSF